MKVHVWVKIQSMNKLILEVVEAVWADGHPDSLFPRLDPSQG